MIDFEPGTSGDAVDVEYVKGVENEIGIDFPSSFLDFMKKNNGGVPVQKYFSIGGNERVVERFLSFVPDYKSSKIGDYDIEVVWSQIEGRLNDYVCPFAALFSGDFLCFDTEGSEGQRVVLWDHERSEDNSPALIEVARSFEDFIKLLRP